MKCILIRHGKTAGNLQGRYIGCRTDEPLCDEGRTALAAIQPPPVHTVFSSPMKRCLETAALLYPDIRPVIIEDFRECDFGDFEKCNYAQLNGREDYQRWIDSGGELPFPNGESRAEFAERCTRAFEELRSHVCQDCALIVHGGTIMAIMEKYARPQGDYFEFQVKNGHGFILSDDGSYVPL